MVKASSKYVRFGSHEIHVTCWGDPTQPPLVMWHGLARTGRDFDEVAQALCDTYFVICPDTVGRGLSTWSDDPAKEYNFQTYGDIANALLDHFKIQTCRWIGTSMGGLIGVFLSSIRLRDRITHLVINDIGPEIPAEAKDRIVSYVGKPPEFETATEYEDWLRSSYSQFGSNSDAFWRRMTDTSIRRTEKGRITVHYDPQITHQFTTNSADFECWSRFDEIVAKTLLLRGAQSDVLPKSVAQEMTQRCPEMITFEGVGHAPTLCSEKEQKLLRDFLAH